MNTKKVRKPNKARKPPIQIPLSFEQTVKGLIGLTPADAKAVRDADPGKKKKK
jgi:hypothetical protein